MIVSRKVGLNKGRPRIWLEGKILVSAGFVVGNKYSIECIGGPEMKLSVNKDGKKKVSGKGAKPIVDILGKAIGECFGTPVPARVTVTSHKGHITMKEEVSGEWY